MLTGTMCQAASSCVPRLPTPTSQRRPTGGGLRRGHCSTYSTVRPHDFYSASPHAASVVVVVAILHLHLTNLSNFSSCCQTRDTSFPPCSRWADTDGTKPTAPYQSLLSRTSPPRPNSRSNLCRGELKDLKLRIQETQLSQTRALRFDSLYPLG